MCIRDRSDAAFLICSDGLYKTLSDDDLRELFATSVNALGAAQSLVTAAFDSGSDDNISVAIAEYGEVPRTAAPTTMVMEAFDPSSEPPPEEEGTGQAAGREGAAEVGAGVAASDRSGESGLDTLVEESSLVGGLPVGALAAIVLVVGALVAILVFGG